MQETLALVHVLGQEDPVEKEQITHSHILGLPFVAQLVKNLPEMWETWVQPLGWEDHLEKGKGYPLQYSGLENSKDYTVHGIAKSQTRLINFHFTSICKKVNLL